MPYIKPAAKKWTDYVTKSITLHNIITNYISNNTNLANHPVTFIKCDIEGGEEDILEDILMFCHTNKSKAYISFHLDWWNNKKITEFKKLFSHFKTNCPEVDLCHYLEKNPFGSLLFEPVYSS